MKSVFQIFCLMLFLTPFAGAQELTGERLKSDLRAILPEAARGFPINNGLIRDDPYSGKAYGTDFSLFGIHEYVSLEYQPAHDYKYSKPTNEKFYFSQVFNDTSSAGKFLIAQGEKILDEEAETMGLKKVHVKQDKAYRENYDVIEYRRLGKPLIVFTHALKDNYTSIYVMSPFRPQDVKIANLLGCMAYTMSFNSFMYVIPVYGAALGDKEKAAGDAYTKSGQVERRYQYEWMPGMSAKQVEQKWGKQFRIIVMNAYTVE